MQFRDESKSAFRELSEVQRQADEDVDMEVQQLTGRYEKKLKVEREESARLKGENGIMRKKFTTLNKEIDDSKTEIKKIGDDEKKLQTIVTSLEREISLLRKDVRTLV